MKWGKVSRAKLDAYRAYCGTFFDAMERKHIQFHSITIDQSRVDHRRFNAGDTELGFSKFLYQLLVKVARNKPTCYLHAYLDRRTTRQSTEHLRTVVNNGLAARWGRDDGPYRRVHFRETENEELLQVNDVVLGAMAARANGHDTKPGAASHKVELAAYIHERAGIASALQSTPRNVTRFTVWNMQLR